jgi:hypothetical protein
VMREAIVARMILPPPGHGASGKESSPPTVEGLERDPTRSRTSSKELGEDPEQDFPGNDDWDEHCRRS